MRRMSGDGGAIAVTVAIMSVVLLGFAALVVDVGALYEERRELQNGADAGALAVAQSCAAGNCGSYLADADSYADDNAGDGFASVTAGDVCGSTSAGLPACTDPPSGLKGAGYVRVTARTENSDGSVLLPPFLAELIVPGYAGKQVNAPATVIWGTPGGVDAKLAITFSQCEYDKLTKVDGETVYAEAPYEALLERTIYFHDTTEASSCPAGPSGADIPGGFGWLDSSGSCTAQVTNGWAGEDPGASASKECKAALESLLGKTIVIPVYSDVNGLNGTNGEYLITNYVGFVLTGWNFPGTRQESSYRVTTPNPCLNSQTCLSGFFVETVAPSSGPVTDGKDQGVRVVQLVS